MTTNNLTFSLVEQKKDENEFDYNEILQNIENEEKNLLNENTIHEEISLDDITARALD